MAETIEPVRPMVLGGVSLGGMIAYEMARHLQPDALVLIATCRSHQRLRRVYHVANPMIDRIPAGIFEFGKLIAPLLVQTFGRRIAEEYRRLVVRMFKESDKHFMKWACKALLHWEPTPLEGIPIRQIHGRCDLIIPASRVGADHWVADGGHLINLTHAQEVNDFIRDASGRSKPE